MTGNAVRLQGRVSQVTIYQLDPPFVTLSHRYVPEMTSVKPKIRIKKRMHCRAVGWILCGVVDKLCRDDVDVLLSVVCVLRAADRIERRLRLCELLRCQRVIQY